VLPVVAAVTPLEVPEDDRAFLLAVQKPQVVESGGWYTTVAFKTGPNAYPYDYNVKCYSVADVNDAALTCNELASTGAAAVGEVATGNLPLRYSKIAVNVTGFEEEAVDCYVTVTGPTGKNSKCSYAGRAESPLFYLDKNGVTIKCPFADVGSTGIVGGVEYTKRARDGTDGLDALVDAGEASWPELTTTCTSGVTDMSELFDVRR
jgi:hypothetical protein